MKLADLDQLPALRRQSGLLRVEIDLTALLYGNLPMYAVRYGLWALAPGGLLVLSAPSTIDSVSFVPGRWSYQFLTQLVVKAAVGLGRLVCSDRPARRLQLERSAPVPMDGPWSAAIIYSGQASEREQLALCVQHLRVQPGIRDGGQLLVCGPPEAEGDIEALPGVEYLALPTPLQAGRFLVGVKKMSALGALRHERVLVCHTRIALRPGCLESLPLEFDLITPRVWVQGTTGPLPYLDLGFFDNRSVALHSPVPQPPIHYDRNYWRMQLGRLYPYIDGGLFCVRRSLAVEVPLSDTVAWGEGEDVEWSLRVMGSGHVLELADDAHADSLTCKTMRYARWGHLAVYRGLSNLTQMARGLVGMLRCRGTGG
jgi:hypothetical protein